MVFAQAAPPPAGGPPPNWVFGVLAGVCGVQVLALLVGTVVAVFFLRTLSRALERCAPDLRLMTPGLVWLNLAPPVAPVWLFVTVIQVSDSLRLEFADRRLDEDEPGGSYGKTLGLSWLILVFVTCGSCCLPVQLAGNGGAAVGLAVGAARLAVLVAVVVVFVLYWVRVAGYARLLADDDDARDAAADRDDEDRHRAEEDGRDRDAP